MKNEKNVIFSDEKSNLDRFKYYSHNLQSNKAVAISRFFGGGYLMWTFLHLVQRCQNAKFI